MGGEMLAVLSQVVWRRRLSLLWWSLGVLGLDALLAVAYPTVRDNTELDKTFAGLPPAVQASLGLDAANLLTSPTGYLNSQYFANLLPIILLVFAIGLAAWSISGDEASGSLELLLANPVSRVRVALERAGALIVLLGILTIVAALGLVLLAPITGLNKGLGGDRILAAAVATGLLALVFASVTFAVGAATGIRSLAITTSAILAVAFFVIEGLAEQVKALRPIREASPWHWLLHTDPLRHGLLWEAWLLPILVSLVLVGAATGFFARRDLH